MPSFFLSANGKAKSAPRKGVKRPRKNVDEKEAKLSRRQKQMANTEISSDEEDSVGNEVALSGSDEEYDDVHERNYRQAKELLAKLEETKKDGEDMGQLLKEDAAQKAGTLKKEIADKADLDEDTEISYRAHRFSPVSVAVSPCKQYIISSGKESSIVKYSIVENKVVGVIKRMKKGGFEQKAHFGHIFAVAISSDGRYIVSGGHDSTLKVWDFKTLEHVRDFAGHRGPITSLCFQMKTNYLFSASRDRSVKLWDLDQMGCVDTMYGHEDAVLSVSALLKQRVVSTGAQDRSCRLWKVEDESQLLFTGHSSCVSMDCVAMLNDDHFVSGSSDGALCVWSVWKKRPIVTQSLVHGKHESGEPRWVVSVAAIPYSDLIATGSSDGEVRLWKISENYRKITEVLTYSVGGFINDIRFSADGKLLVLAVGQEHKGGRWWVNKEARNQVVVLPVTYGDDEEADEAAEARPGMSSDSEEEEDDE